MNALLLEEAQHSMVMGRDGLTRWHDVLSQSRVCDGRDGVAVDVELPPLDGQGVGQSQQAQLGSAVVGLAKVAIKPCCRSRHDDSDQSTQNKAQVIPDAKKRRQKRQVCVCLCVYIYACTNIPLHCCLFHGVRYFYLPSKLLLLHVVPCCPGHVEGTLEVNSLDKVWKKMCTNVCSIIMSTNLSIKSSFLKKSCIYIFQEWTIWQVRGHHYLGSIPLYPQASQESQ